MTRTATGWLQVPPHARGRRKKSSHIDQILVAMDSLKAGCVPRVERFLACLERTESLGKKRTLDALARAVGIEEPKILHDYVYSHDRRWTGVYRANIVKAVDLVCDGPSCEPWMTGGLWADTNGVCLAPRWLQDSRAADRIRSTLTFMALALYRGQTTVSRQVTVDDIVGRRAWWRSWIVGRSGRDGFTWKHWKPWLPGLPTDVEVDFGRLLSAMWTCGLTPGLALEAKRDAMVAAYEIFNQERAHIQSVLSATAFRSRRPVIRE